MQEVSIDKVLELFAPRIRDLLSLILSIEDDEPEQFHTTRPMLNYLKAKSEQAEELLDAYGARTNTQWFPLRESVATLKNFSTACYELLHILYSCQYYNLGNELEGFVNDTSLYTNLLANMIRKAMGTLLNQARALGLASNLEKKVFDFSEVVPNVRLPRNRKHEGPDSVKNRINALATNVLNTTEDVNNFKKLAKVAPSKWDSLDFDFLNETRIRSLEVDMHVLQSLYDTYISDSETENSDPDLLKLRGRITGALHLLRILTIYVHYYERHICHPGCSDEKDYVDITPFRNAIIKYLAHYIALFLGEGRKLCSALLRKYCVLKTVTVKVPPYIGFHMRPSTLVAAIVMHYGCDVTLRLGSSEYDASNAFNLMQANGFIDQKKRAFLLQNLGKRDFSAIDEQIASGKLDRRLAIRNILYKLASEGIVKLYKVPVEIEDVPLDDMASLCQNVYNAVEYLMKNDRRMGISFDASITFTGPEQAVDDIAVLAEADYGESEQGVDLPLPHRLDYLNFKRRIAK
ncbi:MAG: HPr family phosphocarrier protein [Victivallales bacterium]|nr:HPr family phosphocarrier protein [Victivallales bacterium]